MVLQWSDGPEPFAMRCVGICPAVGDEQGHAHIELVSPFGDHGQSVAGFTMTSADCADLAELFAATGTMIRNVNRWSTTGLDELEQYANTAL